ncbi:MAG: hypothetical protein ACF787_11305, partial [Rhodopirellula sp. JB053]
KPVARGMLNGKTNSNLAIKLSLEPLARNPIRVGNLPTDDRLCADSTERFANSLCWQLRREVC